MKGHFIRTYCPGHSWLFLRGGRLVHKLRRLGHRHPPCPLLCGAWCGAPVPPSEPLPWGAASGFSTSICPWGLSLPTAMSQPRAQASIQPMTECCHRGFDCHVPHSSEPLSSWGCHWCGTFSGIWVCMSARVRACSVFVWIAHMCRPRLLTRFSCLLLDLHKCYSVKLGWTKCTTAPDNVMYFFYKCNV